MTHEAMIARAHDVLATEINGLRQADAAIGSTFCEIIEAILATLERGGKIVVTGIGKNIHVGEKIAATMASTGSTAMLLNGYQLLRGIRRSYPPYSFIAPNRC